MARAWEQEQAAIFAEYKRLVASDVPHRAALHRLKAQGGRLTVTDLEEVVRAQGAQERRAEREARAERIRRLHAEGLSAAEIAAQEGLTPWQVQSALRRGTAPVAPLGSQAVQRERRRILALHAQGLLPAAIVERTGLSRNQVMSAIQGVPRGDG